MMFRIGGAKPVWNIVLRDGDLAETGLERHVPSKDLAGTGLEHNAP